MFDLYKIDADGVHYPSQEAIHARLAKTIAADCDGKIRAALIAMGWTPPSDTAYANMPESRRKAIIVWEMFGRPMGDDGIRLLQQAIENSTGEQIIETLRHISKR